MPIGARHVFCMGVGPNNLPGDNKYHGDENDDHGDGDDDGHNIQQQICNCHHRRVHHCEEPHLMCSVHGSPKCE